MKLYFPICKLLISSCLLLYANSSASAQEIWTLEACVDKAMNESFSVQSAQINEAFADLTLDGAQKARYPNLNGNFNLSSNFGRTIDPTTNDFINQAFISNSVGISTGVILYNAGRINNTIKQAEIAKLQASKSTESIKYDIALQVANQYMGVLFAEENIKNARTQLALIESQKTNIDKLISAGVRPANDRFEIDAQLAQSQQAILEAENTIAQSKLNLAQLLRLNTLTIEVDKQNPLGALLNPESISFDQLQTAVFANHPALKAAEYGLESAKVGEDIARSSLYPTLSFGGNLGTTYANRAKQLGGFNTTRVSQDVFINNAPVTFEIDQVVPVFEDYPYVNQLGDNLSIGFGLGINVPIFNNGSATNAIERAKLNTVNQEINQEQTKASINLDLQNILLDAKGAKRKFEASEVTLKSQQAAFDNTTKRFEAGSIGNLEWVTAQNRLQQAQVNTAIAKYEYYFKVKVLEYYLNGIN